MPDKIALRTEKLGDVNTRIIQFAGSNPNMPTVLYHPGMFGDLDNLTNIPRLALESGCSFLALNTIDQDPDGTYPPPNIDFDRGMEIINAALKKYTTESGIIAIANSYGATPLTAAFRENTQIPIKGFFGMAATLHASKVIKQGLYRHLNSLENGKQIIEKFEAGENLKNLPYPRPPEGYILVNLNRDFFDKAQQHSQPHEAIYVHGSIVHIYAEDDTVVEKKHKSHMFTAYQNGADPKIVPVDGGHWSKQIETTIETELPLMLQAA